MDQQSAASSSGLQGNNQSLQSASQSANQGTPLGSVQAVSPSNLLNQASLRLTNPTNSTASQSTATVSRTPTQPSHKANPGLLILPILLILAAIVMFWLTKRSVNKTTYD